MSGDARGFQYALEPLLRRQRWQLDTVQARLGEATRELEDASRALGLRREELERQHASAAQAMTARADAAQHRRNLQWLAQLREGIALAQADLDALRALREEILAECRQRQNRLDVIEKHRESCLADYLLALQNRQAALADSDWLARRGLEETQ